MNKTLKYIMMFFGLGLFIICYDQVAVGQNPDINDDTEPLIFLKIGTNALNISEPIYQTIIGNFIDTKELSTSPTLVTKESFLEEAIMKDIGNVTNNMTFTNTYLSPALIQAKGKGIIETKNGQTIDWISSDIGTVNSTGFYFHGIILFNNAKSEKLSHLNNTIGV